MHLRHPPPERMPMLILSESVRRIRRHPDNAVPTRFAVLFSIGFDLGERIKNL